MPITFEEVTAEVPAERAASPTPPAGEASPADGGEALHKLQQALALRHERECRALTD